MLELVTDVGTLANHQRTHGSSGNLAILWVFLGVLGTAGWLIFSELSWTRTLLVTVLGWVAVVGLTISL
jgi:hypothetical protein